MLRRDEMAAGGRRGLLSHPARFITFSFAATIAVGTALLALPVASEQPAGVALGDALFTATSAVCVTGLIVLDTPGAWSSFGEVVLLALIQVGGIGIMAMATIVLMGLSRRVGLRHRMLAQMETGVLTLGEVRRVLRSIITLTVVVEAAIAVVLVSRFWQHYDESFGRALWLGVFHSVSAFNNAGFALYSDSLVDFVTDPIINLSIVGAIIVGSLGAPVLGELVGDRLKWRHFSLHTKLTLTATAALVLVGWAFVAFFEWTNPATLGDLATHEKGLAALFQGVTPRTAGFNTLDYGAMRETTQLLTSALMFIGAAPASTGGGIKVTTFALLAFVILSEIRGDRDVMLFGRRTPPAAIRQALAIALVGIGVVVAGTLFLLANGDFGLGPSLFEVTSAFGTVGLSTGITADLGPAARAMLIPLMFAGRIGPLTVAAALALRNRDVRFRYPEERPLIG